MGKRVSASATARYFIERVVDANGGMQAAASLEPKLLRRLIRESFCLDEACKCSSENCKCLPCEKRVGARYRRELWSREFRKYLRRAPNAHLNRVLAQTGPF